MPTDIFKSLVKLKNLFQEKADCAVKARKDRDLVIDLEKLRSGNKIPQDATIVPVRVIHSNIQDEATQYIQFVMGSKNSFLLKGKEEEPSVLEQIQSDFNEAFRYPGWEFPQFRTIDGMQLHGWQACEVLYDATKPGGFRVESIRHEDLWFPRDLCVDDWQSAELLVRICHKTKAELLEIPDISPETVEDLFREKAESDYPDKSKLCVQKVFFRKGGTVNVAWAAVGCKEDEFIREPRPLHLGKFTTIEVPGEPVLTLVDGIPTLTPGPTQTIQQPAYETSYPLAVSVYTIRDTGTIWDSIGRAELDRYTQDAATAVQSALVNGWNRASTLQASPAQGTGQPPKTSTVVEYGKVWNESMNFFSLPYPDMGGLALLQAIITGNKLETSQTNFAVNNRKDSRKTAKEIDAVTQQASMLSSVKVTLIGMFYQSLGTICWEIYKSFRGISKDYTVVPAGVVEVLKKQELLGSLEKLWPVVASTPAAMVVLKEYLGLAFPAQASKFIEALEDKTSEQLKTILQGIIQTHPEIFNPNDLNILSRLIGNPSGPSAANTGEGTTPGGSN